MHSGFTSSDSFPVGESFPAFETFIEGPSVGDGRQDKFASISQPAPPHLSRQQGGRRQSAHQTSPVWPESRRREDYPPRRHSKDHPPRRHSKDKRSAPPRELREQRKKCQKCAHYEDKCKCTPTWAKWAIGAAAAATTVAAGAAATYVHKEAQREQREIDMRRVRKGGKQGDRYDRFDHSPVRQIQASVIPRQAQHGNYKPF